MNKVQYAFFEDKFVPLEDAKISIQTNALQYGTGVFGGIRGYYNDKKKFISLFRVKDHYHRLLLSLNILGSEIKYSESELASITKKLVAMNKPSTDVYFRPIAYASSLKLAPNLNADHVFGFAVYMIEMGEYLPVNKGLKVCVSSWRRISDNAIPSRGKITGAYINSALARKEAHDHGYDEAIFLTEEGHVAEGSAENLFMIRDGVLVTSLKTDDNLEGITRRTVIELAHSLKIPVEERHIDRSELYICDELFFSGTGVQTSWISAVDGRKVGKGEQGPITKKVQELFFRVVRGEEKKYLNWCTILKQ